MAGISQEKGWRDKVAIIADGLLFRQPEKRGGGNKNRQPETFQAACIAAGGLLGRHGARQAVPHPRPQSAGQNKSSLKAESGFSGCFVPHQNL